MLKTSCWVVLASLVACTGPTEGTGETDSGTDTTTSGTDTGDKTTEGPTTVGTGSESETTGPPTETATNDPTTADPSETSDPTDPTDPTATTDPTTTDPSETSDPTDPTQGTSESDSDVDTNDPTEDPSETTDSEGTTDGETDSDSDSDSDSDTGIPSCQDELPNLAGQEVVIAPEFEEFYTTYDLGPIPGMPQGALLGGCTIHHEDENTLLIAGESEQPTGKIYRIGVVRGPCGNIIDWDGLAEPVVDAPHVDANLAYGPGNVLFYTHWPTNQVSQLLPDSMVPFNTTEMLGLGVNEDQGVSGLGFVPPNFNDPAGLRVMTWSGGHWYHVDYLPDGQGFELQPAQKVVSLANGPGGFAYVPEGSPGFEVPHIIVSEWSTNTVSVYEADNLGDPKPPTRKDFYTTFPRPWGAYFEPIKGDFMFLTWAAPGQDDRVYITQGFEQPPPTPQ